ncbi:MAG TPA: Crp/Fnr family transcriptional regulator [Sphingomicrobium sp.]
MDNHVVLGVEDKAALAALPHEVRDLNAGSYIVREGTAPGACPVLLEGFAYRQKLASNGERQIVSLHIPGDALDLQHLFLDCADHSVQALTKITVASIPRSALRQLAMARPVIAHAFAVSNQIEASINREWVLNVGRRDAKMRIAHLLCEIAARLAERDLLTVYGLELPMTQEQIGDATGLTSVHVNRMLKTLELEGWIERDGRAIRFPNWEGMRRIADFSPLYLHLGRQTAAGASA